MIDGDAEARLRSGRLSKELGCSSQTTGWGWRVTQELSPEAEQEVPPGCVCSTGTWQLGTGQVTCTGQVTVWCGGGGKQDGLGHDD